MAQYTSSIFRTSNRALRIHQDCFHICFDKKIYGTGMEWQANSGLVRQCCQCSVSGYCDGCKKREAIIGE